MHGVLKLLNELLPTVTREQDIEVQLLSDREAFLMERPDIVEKFGIDLLPVLIQVSFLAHASLTFFLTFPLLNSFYLFMLSSSRCCILVWICIYVTVVYL